jgi:hypothetical protein
MLSENGEPREEALPRRPSASETGWLRNLARGFAKNI